MGSLKHGWWEYKLVLFFENNMVIAINMYMSTLCLSIFNSEEFILQIYLHNVEQYKTMLLTVAFFRILKHQLVHQ